METIHRRAGLGWAVCVMGAWATLAHAQPVNVPEIEPNDNKTQATLANGRGNGMRAFPPPGDTDSITGTSTGNGGSGGGIATADYFLMQTAATSAGLYCYYVEGDSSTGQSTSMRGLIQSSGIIIPGTDVSIQTNVSTPTKDIWYGTGPQQKFYLKVQGTAATTGAYAIGYRCVPYEAITIGTGSDNRGPFPSGTLVISGFSTPTADLDFWVYDSNFHAIPGYGHDDPDATGLNRTFTPGTYYVALTDQNLVNELPSPPDDANRNKPVSDFPGIIASSSPVFPINTIGLQINAGGTTYSVSTSKVHAFQVLFFVFSVEDPTACAPCPADFNNDGGVDGADVTAFFAAWEAGELCGDTNGDGGITGDDVGTFFAAWEAGGC